MNAFEHRTAIPASPEELMEFHNTPGILQRLTPPPIFVQLLEDRRQSLTQGELAFILWFGPLPLRWRAEHSPGRISTSFTDELVAGPVAIWKHEHIFEPHEKGAWLIDRLAIAHKPGLMGILTRFLFAEPFLRLLFIYRHWRTRRDLLRSRLSGEIGWEETTR